MGLSTHPTSLVSRTEPTEFNRQPSNSGWPENGYYTGMCVCVLSIWQTHNTHNHFTSHFLGLPRWAGASRSELLVYGAREDNRGRHTDHPDGRQSIRTNQWPTSIILPIFTPDALPAATLPLYPGLGQAPNTLAYIPSGVVTVNMVKERKIQRCIIM